MESYLNQIILSEEIKARIMKANEKVEIAMKEGKNIWVTGRPGSGKSTLAIGIAMHLEKDSANRVTFVPYNGPIDQPYIHYVAKDPTTEYVFVLDVKQGARIVLDDPILANLEKIRWFLCSNDSATVPKPLPSDRWVLIEL